MNTKWYDRISLRTWILIGVAIIGVFVLILLLMGRVPWCTCGYIKFWHGIVQSSENSQHISDWYSFSHIIHGFAFYGIFWLIGRRWLASSATSSVGSKPRRAAGPFGLRLIAAIIVEVTWEIFENSNFIINRYRAATISLDYFGDSVINSVADVLFMVIGFVLAARLPIWMTIALIVIMEVFVGYWIRDNLALNIIMLIYPLEAIKAWQLGG